MRLKRTLAIIAPGILVAATGVGAGDLATAGFSGSQLGVAVLWAVVVGATLKFVLTEGLARWQLVTGDTLLEGGIKHLGKPVQYAFLLYFLPWTYFVGSAMISACGVAAQALFPVFDDPEAGRITWGIIHSLVGAGLVAWGGYRLFEKVMGVCIGLMFMTVIVSAIVLQPDWSSVLAGTLMPTIPQARGEGLTWTVALMGGIGGTVTMLSYGYWIREEGRVGESWLRACRIDLACGYGMTAIFGVAMVIIGSFTVVSGGGAGLLVELADALTGPLGEVGRWVFLAGAWAAIFSSLLGVWQSVPYLFANVFEIARNPTGGSRPGNVDTRSLPYRAYLFGLATVPMLGLFFSFRDVLKWYTVVGAAFLPMLALVLLLLNSSKKLLGERYRNGWFTIVALIMTMAFFLWAGWLQVRPILFG